MHLTSQVTSWPSRELLVRYHPHLNVSASNMCSSRDLLRVTLLVNQSRVVLFFTVLHQFVTLNLWGHRVSDIHPPFVLSLRPMLRPIIANEEDSGDHGNPGNRAEDNSVLG